MGSGPEPTDVCRNPCSETPTRVTEKWVLWNSLLCKTLYFKQVLPGAQQIRPSLLMAVQEILRKHWWDSTPVCTACYASLFLNWTFTLHCFHYSKSGHSLDSSGDSHFCNRGYSGTGAIPPRFSITLLITNHHPNLSTLKVILATPQHDQYQ